jgi:hypothetical protein
MTDECFNRIVKSSHRLTGTNDWARARIMYERFSYHLRTVPLRDWRLLLVEEQIAWRELAKMYRVSTYNKKGVKV